MRVRGCLVAVVVLLVLLLGGAGRGRADELGDAKIHYKAGAAYYKAGDWRAAKREFEEAFRLSGRTPLHFNIALCEEKLGEYELAVAALKSYLATPEGERERAVLEKKIREDEERAARREPAPPPSGPTAETRTVAQLERTPERAGMPATRRAGFGLLGAGGVVLATSLALALVAHREYGDLEGRCGPDGKQCPPDFADQRDRGRALALGADVLLGVGVAAVAASVVLLVLRPRPSPARASMRVAPSGNGLAVTF